ncbi:hypothetical protein IID22_02275 [Patescibacteria group bacterium]|nr:hypothetical protein [Patescibacteria group bacterium]
MTVSDTYTPQRDVGNGVTTAFAFSHNVASTSEVVVHKVVRATNAKTLQVEGSSSDYTVTLNTTTEGGTVNYAVAPLSTEDSLIERLVTYDQNSDIPNVGDVREDKIEGADDKLTRLAQQLREIQDRTVKASVERDTANAGFNYTLPPFASNAVIAFNNTISGFSAKTLASLSSVGLPSTSGLAVYVGGNTLTSRTLSALGNIKLSNALVTLGNPLIISSAIDQNITDVANNLVEAEKGRARKVCVEVSSNSLVTVRKGAIVAGVLSGGQQTLTVKRTANLTLSAAGGLQSGSTEANNTHYAVVVILDTTLSNSPNAMLVPDALYPAGIVLPTGYNDYKRVGAARNDGSGNLLPSLFTDRKLFYEDQHNVLLAGSATTFSAIGLTSFVPSWKRDALLWINLETGVGSGTAHIRETSQAAAVGHLIAKGSEASGHGRSFPISVSQSLDYKLSIGTADAYVTGYEDDLERNP